MTKYAKQYLMSLAWFVATVLVAFRWFDHLYQQNGDYPGELATWGILIGSAVIVVLLCSLAMVAIYVVLTAVYGPPPARQKIRKSWSSEDDDR